MQDSSAVLAGVANGAYCTPVYVVALFMAALFSAAALTVIFMARYFRAKNAALDLDASTQTLKRGRIGELLWVFAVVASGTAVELLSDGETVDVGSRSLLCIGILSLTAAGYFAVNFVKSRRSCVYGGLLKCVEKIAVEITWVFWLVSHSSTVFTDVAIACFYSDYDNVTWLEYISAHGFNRTLGTALLAVRIFNIIFKYRKAPKR